MSLKIRKLFLYCFMLAIVLASAGFAILSRIINTTKSRGEFFSHPFFIPLSMVIGDAFCIFIYVYEIQKARKRFGSYQLHPKVVSARTKGRSTHLNPFKLFFPRLTNILALWILSISYSFTGVVHKDEVHSNEILTQYYHLAADGEIKNTNALPYISFELALALQGIFILFIAAISRLLLKKYQYLHHWISIGIILAATCLITVPLYIDEPQTALNVLLGTGLVLGSVLLFCLQFIQEEKLLDKHFISPARLVGWEGIWGILLMALILPGFYFVKWNERFWANGRLEDSIFALKQMGSSVLILLSLIAMLFLSATTNMFGVTVMKYTSGNNRASLLILRMLPSWIFFIIFNGTGRQKVNYVQLAGYVLLFIGVILYNEIITIPFFGLNENTREKLDKKDQEAESSNWDEESRMSVRSSIHYDINI